VRRSTGKSGHIFLYSAVIREDVAGGSNQYSVSNMLTERHDAASMEMWLLSWLRDGARIPPTVVIDMSKALFIAVTRAFAGVQSTAEYLRMCPTNAGIVENENESRSVLPPCFIRNDVAHVMKLMSSWNCLKGAIGCTRQFYLRVLGQIVQSNSLRNLHRLLMAFCTVALSETEGTTLAKAGDNWCERETNFLSTAIVSCE
jgi:hypothetical protein